MPCTQPRLCQPKTASSKNASDSRQSAVMSHKLSPGHFDSRFPSHRLLNGNVMSIRTGLKWASIVVLRLLALKHVGLG